MRRSCVVAAALLGMSGAAWAGPYAPAAGQSGSTAISRTDLRIVGWASGYSSFDRGYQDVAKPTLGTASYGDAADALGLAEGTSYNVVSLGDGGSITLTFDRAITNGAGADFAVFENGFGDMFLELAFVEVSSNGSDFFRFPSVSLTPSSEQVDTWGILDPTDLHNLAGKYRQGWGTPFDLEELKDISPLLDVSVVTHVRVIDVVGSIDPAYATRASAGNIVNDPYPTAFSSGGFDLDGVGVINQVHMPEPAMAMVIVVGAAVIGRLRVRG